MPSKRPKLKYALKTRLLSKTVAARFVGWGLTGSPIIFTGFIPYFDLTNCQVENPLKRILPSSSDNGNYCCQLYDVSYPSISPPYFCKTAISCSISSGLGCISEGGGRVGVEAGSLVSRMKFSKPAGERRNRSRAGPLSTR